MVEKLLITLLVGIVLYGLYLLLVAFINSIPLPAIFITLTGLIIVVLYALYIWKQFKSEVRG